MNTIISSVVSYASFILFLLMVTGIMNRHMAKREFRFNKWVNYAITGGIGLLLAIISGGVTIWAIKGSILCLILLYASIQDHTNHEADDWLSVMIFILSLVGVSEANLASMLIGAVAVFVPQFLIVLFSKGKNIAIGGADIKLSSATAFLLGFWKGAIGYMLGLFIAVVYQLIQNAIKRKNLKEAFPLLPYLSIGLMVGYLI